MTSDKRLQLAKKSLKGTSIGDAFGESFFGRTDEVVKHIQQREIPETKWEFTDDTVMAIAVYDQLKDSGGIDQDNLSKAFVKNHNKDINRGYGATARRILREIGEGAYWKEVSQQAFEGMGSMGNGASMRVCPIGAYHFDSISKVKELAIKSAETTHTNLEGITGAIAVAAGAAIATSLKVNNHKITPNEFINRVIEPLPDTDTKSKISKSLTIPDSYNIETVKSILGNGSKIQAQDTVPFSIWCSAHNLYNFEEALWKAVSVLGDRDTICAIVGGITIMSSYKEKIPGDWSESVEDFETSIFMQQ